METCKARMPSAKVGFQPQTETFHCSYLTAAHYFGCYHYKRQPDKHIQH